MHVGDGDVLQRVCGGFLLYFPILNGAEGAEARAVTCAGAGVAGAGAAGSTDTKWRRESGRGVVLDVLVLGAGLLSVAVQGWSRLGATCLGNTAGARVSDARGLYRADQERQSLGSWRRLLP